MSTKEITGAIFPILSEHVERLLEEKKNVFVKFTKLKRLGKGSKIIFYISREKVLVGEGTIVNIESLDPEMAWIRYGKQIFLNKEEYDDYVKRSPTSAEERKMGEITTFVLRDLKKYKGPIKSIYTMTPAGRYLTKGEYYKIKRS